MVHSKNTKDDGCPALSEGLWKQFHQPSILQKKGAWFLFPLKHEISFLGKICGRIIFVFSIDKSFGWYLYISNLLCILKMHAVEILMKGKTVTTIFYL